MAAAAAASLLVVASGCGDEGTACVSSRDCPSGVRCVDGECSSESRDAGHVDAGAASCDRSEDCDDAVDCTRDVCVEGACENVPDDSACENEADGRCVAGFGCAYGACSPATCVGGPCQTAHCQGDVCVLEAMCASDQECCGDACVPMGCDDDDPCTDDACGSAGCEHASNADVCDDGVYCNGPDTCAGGVCAMHAGDPCPGMSTCSEAMSACLACVSDDDCPAPTTGPWSACSYASACVEAGARERTITTYRCVASTCQATPTTEMDPCTRTTAGTTCGATTYGTWSACGGFTTQCDETGTRSRPRMDQVCAAGTCTTSTTSESEACGRTTAGAYCVDFARCVEGTCSGGTCGTGAGCPAGRRCCEPGICVCSGCLCP